MNSVNRVLLCCEHYSPSIGGVQEVIRQIAERMSKAGYDVTVATGTHPMRPADTVIDGVRVLSFPISGNRVRGMYGPLERYKDLLMHGGFDALLIKAAQQWTFDAAVDIFSELKCQKFFIPCGFSALSRPDYAQYFEEMPRWLSSFDGLIFYSEDYQDIAFARAHGLSCLHCLPNGVDEKEFSDPGDNGIRQRLGIPADHDLLLSVGSLIAGKGHWEVLRAFAQARLDRPTTLVINGNSPGKGSIAIPKRVLKHILSGCWPLAWELRWYGLGKASGNKSVHIVDLPRSELIDLYKAADLFLYASHIEYSPLVLFEAVAGGTPFIASSAGNSKEIARWTRAGWIVPAKGTENAQVSVSELARQIKLRLSDKALLKTKGQEGRKLILSQGFTWECIVKRYEKIICGTNEIE